MHYFFIDYNSDGEDVDVEYLQRLCKTFHETMNTFQKSPIYISWIVIE